MSNTTYYVPNESGNVLSGAILDYDDFMLVSSGGTALDTTVNSGGTMCCILGGSAIGTVLNHGRMWLDTSSGIAQDTVVNSGADITIYSGCMASNTTVNDGGFIDVPNTPGLGIESLNEKLIKKNLHPDFPEAWAPTTEWDKEWSNDRQWS